MTTEERILIDLPDILALEFTCKGCGAKTTRSPHAERQHIPEKCSGCNEDFWPFPDSILAKAMRNLYNAIRDGARMAKEAPFAVQLVIKLDEPGEPDPAPKGQA